MTLVVAHRGSAQNAPQNSVAAFLDARRLGADGVELDVRRSRDGALVVCHDPGIDGLGDVCDLSVADLPESVPLLSEAVAACQGMLVNVEIKNSPGEPGHDASGSLVAQVIAELSEVDHAGGLIISSFDLATVEAVRAAGTQMPTGLLLEPGDDLFAAVATAAERGFDAIHPFVIGLAVEAVGAAHAAGLEVNVWTVNAPHDMEALVDMGVDAIITDEVTTARAVVDGS